MLLLKWIVYTAFSLIVLFFVLVFMTIDSKDSKTATVAATVVPAKTVSEPKPGAFPIIGATYQLNRARFPEGIAVCYTANGMNRLINAFFDNDNATIDEMVLKFIINEDAQNINSPEGCTTVSSFSQAKIIEKGNGIHRAEFFANPLIGPMWGASFVFWWSR